MARRLQYLEYVYRSRGVWGVAYEVLRRVLRPICQHQRQAIFLCDVEQTHMRDADGDEGEGTHLECLTLESGSALEALEGEMPSAIFQEFRRRFEAGRIAFVARGCGGGGMAGRIVGYSLCERGVFSAMGRTRTVSPDILFGHYIYVDPACRGRRIFQRLRGATREYCRVRGIKTICAVVTTANRASLRARLRTGDRNVGTVSRLALLGGLFVRETPWKEIEAALER